MQIVGIDNWGRDNVSDFLHAINVPETEAAALCAELNARYGDRNSTYYVVKPDDYTLFKWEP